MTQHFPPTIHWGRPILSLQGVVCRGPFSSPPEAALRAQTCRLVTGLLVCPAVCRHLSSRDRLAGSGRGGVVGDDRPHGLSGRSDRPGGGDEDSTVRVPGGRVAAAFRRRPGELLV